MNSFESAAVERFFDTSLEYERLLAGISHSFLAMNANNLERGVEEALREICQTVDAGHGSFLEIASDGLRVDSIHSYDNGGGKWHPDALFNLTLREYQWLREQLRTQPMFHIEGIEEFPSHAIAEQNLFRIHRIGSLACVPFIKDDSLCGFACFTLAPGTKRWAPDELRLMRAATQSVGAAIHRLRADLELESNREWLDLAQLAGRSTVWEWHPKDDTLIFSSSTAEVFGFDRKLMPRTSSQLLEFVPAADRESFIENFTEIMKTGDNFSIEHRFNVPRLGIVWILIRGEVHTGPDGRAERVVGVSADITERKTAEYELQHLKERAQVTLAAIGDGVVRTDAGGRIDYLNPSAEELLGVRFAQVRGQELSRFYNVICEETLKPQKNVVRQCLAGRHRVEPAAGSLLIRAGESRIPIRQNASPIFDVDGELVGAVLVLTDVSQLRTLQKRMSHLATHDPLTGLINRREFELRLGQAIAEANQGDRRFALCYLDLDEFKVVNDTCGHGAGDSLLRELTSVLDAVVQNDDTLARLGGDEFGMLLADCDLDHAARHAQEVIDAVRQYRFQWNDRVFEIAASIGIVPIEGGNNNLAELLSAADSACYVAKGRGRNEIHVSKTDDHEIATRHTEMRWVERINRALAEDRFCLFKQPIMPLQNSQGPEFNEILLRLQDAQGSIVAPSQFIGAAERYRLMPVIDLWVVGAALDLIGSLGGETDKPSPAFTINLSGQSFGNTDLKRLILDSLDRLEIPPQMVLFEITETAAISNLSQAIEFMRSLRDRGCRFVLDDFGSGLSSFRYLKSLDVEFLKIDGELVREIASDPIQREMVAAIHRIGESMGIQTIGEWVENSEIERTLTDIGVDYAQGFGVGRPVPFLG